MAPRALVILFIGVFAGIVGVVGLAMVALVGLVGLDPTPPLGGPPSGLVPGRIPAAYLRDYRAAAATCPGLPWSVLAAIGEVETAQGRDDHPSTAGAVVIYRWDGGLWHLRNEATGGRGSLVSEGSLARGQGGGHSGFIGSPAHDDQISSVASGVSI